MKYGLASSVFIHDHSRARRVSRRLDFGCVWINTHTPLVAEITYGGFKHSGHGKDLSMYGLDLRFNPVSGEECGKLPASA